MSQFNKALLTSSIFCLLSFSVTANDRGTVTITGNVTDSTCVVPGSQLTRAIQLNPITPAELSAATVGAMVKEQEFSFDVTGCAASTTGVGMRFTYTADSNNANYLENSGDAEGVLLGITTAANVAVANNDVVPSTDYSDTTNSGTIAAKVRAFRIAGETGAGSINSTASVELQIQ